jgi:hypothetical protein
LRARASPAVGPQRPAACELPGWLDLGPASLAPDAPADTEDATARSPLETRPPRPSRDEFVTAFEQFGGNVRALARHFRRERRQIYRWIQAHGMRGLR